MEIKKTTKIGIKDNIAYLINTEKDLKKADFTNEEMAYIKKELKAENKLIVLNKYNHYVFVVLVDDEANDFHTQENTRIAGANVTTKLNELKEKTIVVSGNEKQLLIFAEGMALANYQFLKYLSEKKENSLSIIQLFGKISPTALIELNETIKAVHYARNLVNEPVSFLNATQFAQEIKKLGKEAGFKVEVFGKAKIEALEMGGLLAVNKGSIDPPSFSVLEWKPKNAKNKKPIILVGKGVVYDTGGVSLKPTPNSMDFMKCDMGGAAAVIGALYAISKNKLPYYVVGLVPATDNRPGGNAFVPGDVITMHNKKTVEVLNTDAEGRLLLADALSYAQKYKPEIVIDAATLTGVAAAAIGHYGIVAMGNTEDNTFTKLKTSGNNVYERIVEFPFWDEYNEQLKSQIADTTNLGSGAGGAITAGKFLEKFTDYPYIHLDIAGPAFIKKPYHYLTYGGSGVGVRLFYDFVKNF